ncbi:hypothetical protein IV203_033636 [Nitzschia inconspicua]|uniref:Uncharacterized protein n=1 Tax=Nitzschia inconspicua TaxID=303405 RepID=A0A9K3Q662_9STRA|nr:hypothetical protein IV203_033636 [Nitzschia inconspicua]
MAPNGRILKLCRDAKAPRTRQEKEELKSIGCILGHFSKLPVGRPPKAAVVVTAEDTKKDEQQGKQQQSNNKNKRKAPSEDDRSGPAKKLSRTNWKAAENFPLLRDAVLSATSCIDTLEKPTNDLAIAVPATTLKDNIKAFSKAANTWNVPLELVTRDMVFAGANRPALLSENDIAFLSECITKRDESNNGMSRKEVIRMVQEIAQCSSFMTAENHYDYLVRKKKLIGVKRNGRVTTAQPTTTKRSQVTPAQQLRWHTAFEDALNTQKRLNLPADEFAQVHDSFVGNLDESCFMANADGSVKVVGSAAKTKTEKITDDCRVICAIELVKCLGRKATGRGGGAKQKIAQRRLNIVDGNVNSYARCLNDPRRLASMREMDQLISAVAQVAADQAREKVERKEVAAAKAKERKKKQAEEAAADTKKRDELKPALEAIMAKFVSGEKTAPAGFEEMSKSQLVNILKYFYDEKPRGLATMGKNKLVAHVMKFYDPSHSA